MWLVFATRAFKLWKFNVRWNKVRPWTKPVHIVQRQLFHVNNYWILSQLIINDVSGACAALFMLNFFLQIKLAWIPISYWNSLFHLSPFVAHERHKQAESESRKRDCTNPLHRSRIVGNPRSISSSCNNVAVWLSNF